MDNQIKKLNAMNNTNPVMMSIGALPEKITSRLEGDYHLLAQSRLGGLIFDVMDREHRAAILKVGRGRCAADLRDEATCLNIISGCLPVPDVFCFAEENEYAYLLMSKLPGVAGHAAGEIYSIDTIIKAYAESLYKIHNMAIVNKTIPQAINKFLSEAERLVASNKINNLDFSKATGMEPSQVLAYLDKRMGSIEENTFTHGDYCLPNIILHSDGTSVIDWGLGAVSNVNRDFMCVELSIRMNFDEKYINDFYSYYKGEAPNPELVKYFWLCDQFEKYQIEN